MAFNVCRSAIERLISLGFYYRELNRFATESRDLSWIQSSVDVSSPHADKTQKGKVRKGSVYRRAIANGLTEVLSVYRSAVLQVEQNLLSDPLPILATVTHGLNKVCPLTSSKNNFCLQIPYSKVANLCCI
jgi:gamma-tubulin complex component 4